MPDLFGSKPDSTWSDLRRSETRDNPRLKYPRHNLIRTRMTRKPRWPKIRLFEIRPEPERSEIWDNPKLDDSKSDPTRTRTTRNPRWHEINRPKIRPGPILIDLNIIVLQLCIVYLFHAQFFLIFLCISIKLTKKLLKSNDPKFDPTRNKIW
jgi:hypothetical protein